MYTDRLQLYQKSQSGPGTLGDSEIAEALTSGYAEAGYPEAMRRAAQRLTERSIQVHVPAIRIARLYAHAGAKDQALHKPF